MRPGLQRSAHQEQPGSQQQRVALEIREHGYPAKLVEEAVYVRAEQVPAAQTCAKRLADSATEVQPAQAVVPAEAMCMSCAA